MDRVIDVSVDVSVIIATYNVERYVERAIRSALDQEGVAVEIIAADDCSTDGTWEIMSSIGNPRLSCFRLPVNSGPGAARNAAIARATGTWIAILDGDDAFDSGRLARCLRRAGAHQADIVVDNLTVVREADGATFPMFPPGEFSRQGILTLARFISGNRSFFKGFSLGYLKPVFSAEFLRRHSLAYDPEIRIGEDYLLLAEALASGAVCAVEPTAGYLYTARAGSISHRLAPADMTRIADCDRKFLSRHSLDKEAAEAQKRREFCIRDAYAFTLLVEGLKTKDFHKIARLIKTWPFSAIHLWEAAWIRVRRLFA